MAKQGNIKVPKSASSAGPRVKKLTKKQLRAKTKAEIQSRNQIAGSFKLVLRVLRNLRHFWKPLTGILVVYLLLNVLFASGFGNLTSAVKDVKDNLNSTTVSTHPLVTALAGLATLTFSAGASTTSTSSVLQTVLIILESLAIIWALRQLLAGTKIKVKQAYYESMTPLIPFLLVGFVILVQLAPMTFGTAVAAAILSAFVLSSGLLAFLLGGLFVLLAAWSVYMLSSSIFALYIVTLPGMQPRQALRSAKDLVRFRRWLVLRRVLFLPIFLTVFMAVIIVPLILYATPVVVPVFYVLSALALLFTHAYFYNLYRDLIA